MANNAKTQRNLNVSLDLDEQLTWAELFRFVDLAREAGVQAQDTVGYRLAEPDVYDDRDSCGHVVALMVYVDPATLDVAPRDASSLAT
ncbi:MAG: hypothetical protein JO222_10220 [Frankiales bacterium]|nr:hypothetical protein [Frankiales bacterium]